MRKVILLSASILAWTVFFSMSITSYAKEARGVTEGTVKVGGVMDLTGPAADAHSGFIKAWRIYFKHINDQGGINGRKIKFILEDDRTSIPLAVAAFKKLVYRDKVLALIGPGSTGANQTLFRHIQKEKLVNMAVGCAGSMYKPFRRYVFATGSPSYEDHIRTWYDYLLKNLKVKNPKMAIVGADHEYSHTHLREAKKCVEHYKIPLHEEVISFGALDATSQVLGLKRAKAEYVILNVPPGATAAVMRDARKFAYSPTFLGTYYCSIEVTLQIAKEAAKNFIGIHNYNSWYAETPGTKELRDITHKYEPNIDEKYLTKFYCHGWIISTLLCEGLKNAGSDLDHETLVAGLEKIKDLDTKGICGLISYSPSSHKASDYCMIFKSDVKKARFVPIGTWRKPSSIE